MNITIAGCGKIGKTILADLVAEQHNITVIDTDMAVVTDVSNTYDVIGFCGNALDCDVMTESNVQDTDLFIATTDSDETNMLSCFFAKKLGASHTISRIRNKEFNGPNLQFFRNNLDIDLSINPELLSAQELFNIIKLPSAAKVETFSRRHFEMIELLLREDSPLIGKKLSEMRNHFDAKFLIGIVQRGENVYIPDGNFELQSGDRIGVTATPNEIGKFLKSLRVIRKQTRNVMILGGSRIAYYLAKMLENSGIPAKIIERNKEICEELAEDLPQTQICCGDGAQQDYLLEEGLESTDAFVALTGMDEENILTSVFANSVNVPTVLAKINRDELSTMATSLGLDSVIAPGKVISDGVVRYARALQNSMDSDIETLYSLMDDKAEALEFCARSDFQQLNVPLKDIQFKKNILVAGIIRNRQNAIIPGGNDVIKEGDNVVVLSIDHHLNTLSDILE